MPNQHKGKSEINWGWESLPNGKKLAFQVLANTIRQEKS